MKTYHKNNFFKHTFCEFTEIDKIFLTQHPTHFKSKAASSYSYTEEGVYRYSNHWGRVANCRWKIKTAQKHQSQEYYLGYAKWIDFHPLNKTEKQFYIVVNFDKKIVDFQYKGTQENVFLFTSLEAQKKVQQIRLLLKEEKWATYFEEDIAILRKNIILEYIHSNKTLLQVKREQQ